MNKKNDPGRLPGKGQRGVIIIIVAVSLFVLIGIGALAIDIGYLATTRSELQNVADAAALAGARYLGEVYKEEGRNSFSFGEVYAVVQEVAGQNKAANEGITISSADVLIGLWDAAESVDDIYQQTLVGPDAVRVIARRDGSSANGPISTFLARVFNINTMNVGSKKAIAALSGPSTIDSSKLTTPFGLSQQLFPNNCTDQVKFNPSASCAGWHNFIWHPSASNMDTIAMGIILNHVSETPGMSSGEDWLKNFPINFEKLTKDLEKILTDDPIPEVYETGTDFYFQGGPITSLFNGSYINLESEIKYDGNTGEITGTPAHSPAPFFALFDYFRFRDNDGDNSKWTAIVPVYKELSSCKTASGGTEIIGFARVEIIMPVGPPDKLINVIVDCNLSIIDGRGSGTTYGNLRGTIPNLVR